MPNQQSRLEILSTELLDQQRMVVTDLRQLAKRLRLDFGWHYLLDLTWIISNLGQVEGKTIMDAGAGVGVLQWYLAGKGSRVISVDRMSRAGLALHFRAHYQVSGLRNQDLLPASQVLKLDLMNGKYRSILNGVTAKLKAVSDGKAPGSIAIYNQDLKALHDIADSSIDAVVAVSSLEHNSPQGLETVVNELVRVLKPGGILLATLGAAKQQDWFHEASQGWCYTADTLRNIFSLPENTPDNYARHDELLANLRGNVELRENLARFYFASGDNGMPWGKWDPQYQPVGVIKYKDS